MQDDCQHCRSMAQQQRCQAECVGKLRDSMYAHSPHTSPESSTVAVSSIRIESYIPYGRLNHFCGSRSHSPQPPGVNVNSTIRKAPGRHLPTPSFPHIVIVIAFHAVRLSCWILDESEHVNRSVCQSERICACPCPYVPTSFVYIYSFYIYGNMREVLKHEIPGPPQSLVPFNWLSCQTCSFFPHKAYVEFKQDLIIRGHATSKYCSYL